MAPLCSRRQRQADNMVKAQESKLMGQYSQAKRSAFKRLKDKLSWGGE
ncbi:hypothetical protein CLOLEP_02223 [[Clostridium] leptum DSM 753]|jgi:hypothetical protein|uniref:Uncharacterized protein n=1 Tax=[Clostridium] leptum DSM 753 TaxID=428125 RepID=A7VUH7_9FIRM|nr:hypothetical protein CLOLEP_02223 [[Clostridium] leptum DSM 753]